MRWWRSPQPAVSCLLRCAPAEPGMPLGRTPAWHRRPEAPSPCAAGSLRSRSPALAIDTTRHDSITSHAPTNSVSQCWVGYHGCPQKVLMSHGNIICRGYFWAKFLGGREQMFAYPKCLNTLKSPNEFPSLPLVEIVTSSKDLSQYLTKERLSSYLS